MRRLMIVISSFFIMLCLGGVYAWSMFVPELKNSFGYSTAQTQLVFGLLIGVFPISMIFAEKLLNKIGTRLVAVLSSIAFGSGYLLAGNSNGNYILVLLGIGVLAGIGTGFGYLAALTTPVKVFPKKKGLITGIAAGGFGIAAVVLSNFAEYLFESGKNVLQTFNYIGIVYFAIIMLFALFLHIEKSNKSSQNLHIKSIISDKKFIKLLLGLFFGTFAGLLVIGNLKPIGAISISDNRTLALGISVFAVANFTGRLSWGFLSDYIKDNLLIFCALLVQAVSIFLIGIIELTTVSYILLSFAIGFGFGANFVLFAKRTAHVFGLDKLGFVYSYVFLGYAIAGILGPITGGFIFDFFQSYSYATIIASVMSTIGALMFLRTEKIK